MPSDKFERPAETARLNAPELARFFHDEYERLAPEFGYTTRPESRVAWDDVPENNRMLMMAVAQSVLNRWGANNGGPNA